MPLVARCLLALFIALAGLIAGADELIAVPPLKARVTDLTGTLTAEQAGTLEDELADVERQRGSQIVVLLVPTTGPETIESFGIRVADAWKIGRQGVDDGVILIVAKNDRKMRIEVGRGLEGVLPDAIAKRIVSEDIAPHFRGGDFYGGIRAGVRRVEAVISGEPLPPPKPHSRQGRTGWERFEELLVVGIIAATILGGILNAIFGRLFGSSLTGGLVGAIAWMITGSLIAGAVAGFLVLFFVLAFGGRGGGFGGWMPGSGGWGGGGWRSSGGRSSGGFSGGGGGFGGGGASGNW